MASKKKDPNEETVTEAEAGAAAAERSDEVRAGLATGSNAANPDQPDGHVLQTTVTPANPGEPSTAANSVILTADGKDGPAA